MSYVFYYNLIRLEGKTHYLLSKSILIAADYVMFCSVILKRYLLKCCIYIFKSMVTYSLLAFTRYNNINTNCLYLAV